MDPVTTHSSLLQQAVALAVIAFVGIVARVSLGNYRRRPPDPGVTGSTVLGPGLRGWYFENLQPLEEWCVRRGIPPARLSYAQLLGSALVGLCYATGALFLAGWLLLLTGSLDIIDGRVARRTRGASARGAFLDSVIDRYVEAFAYFGLAVYYRDSWVLWAVLFALLGSMMVSYARARSEGLGVDIRVGILQRPERVVMLGFGTIFGVVLEHLTGAWLPGPPFVLVILTIVSIAVLANITAVQRIVYTWRALEGPGHVASTATAEVPLPSASSSPQLTGKAKRVVGTFLLMIGAGLLLDGGSSWMAAGTLLAGVVVFGVGLLALRARGVATTSVGASGHDQIPASHPVGSNR